MMTWDIPLVCLQYEWEAEQIGNLLGTIDDAPASSTSNYCENNKHGECVSVEDDDIFSSANK